MKIKVDQFCSLATSPSWQAWLYHYNVDVYRKFIAKLQASRGCTQNREIMTELLALINGDASGSAALGEFLNRHYPYMVEGGSAPAIEKSNQSDIVFECNPKLLTYPRRIIFTGDQRSLQRKIAEFTLDKIKHDSIIVGNKAYIEYLTKDDRHLASSIPDGKWLIAAYRLKVIN